MVRRTTGLLAIIGLIWIALRVESFAADPLPVDPLPKVLVVRPSDWSASLEEWIEYRSSEFEIIEIDSIPNPFRLRDQILEIVEQANAPVEAILLCGDVLEDLPETKLSKEPPPARRILTPSFQLETTVQLGPAFTPNLSTDVLFGDIDDDGCPEISVGRIPVQTGSELKRVLARSIKYETSKHFGAWRDDVHVTAGVGGFGFLADAAIEAVARRYLAEGLPDRFRVRMTYASLTSPYCPDPFQMKSTYIKRLNEGGLFWVYIGHGWIDRLDHFEYGDKLECICAPEDIPSFDMPNGPPIAIMLACYTGAIDATVACFGKQLMTQPNGPIAVIGGSRVTMPYGLSQLAGEMIEEAFLRQDDGTSNTLVPTLGRILVNAKRNVWQDDSSTDGSLENSTMERENSKLKSKYKVSVEQMARALSPPDHSLLAERREHIRLMNLLGDPLLKIQMPDELPITGPLEILAGEMLSVRAESQRSGRLQIELRMHRDQLPSNLVNIGRYAGTPEQRELMQKNHERANDLVLWRHEVDVTPGSVELDIPVPKDTKGKQVVWMRMEHSDGWSIGTHRFSVKRSRSTPDK
ncbi:C25 family cysteine peptidase [Pirellulaceae bacterium SH449]